MLSPHFGVIRTWQDKEENISNVDVSLKESMKNMRMSVQGRLYPEQDNTLLIKQDTDERSGRKREAQSWRGKKKISLQLNKRLSDHTDRRSLLDWSSLSFLLFLRIRSLFLSLWVFYSFIAKSNQSQRITEWRAFLCNSSQGCLLIKGVRHVLSVQFLCTRQSCRK